MIRSVVIAAALMPSLVLSAPRARELPAVGPVVPGLPGYDCRMPTPFDHDAVGPWPRPGARAVRAANGYGRTNYGYGTGGASASGAVAFPADSAAPCDLGELTLGRKGLDILGRDASPR
ncbi:hypothetical protein VQ02_15065 [Methylobacterium variabile]|jgi:hypothetical protein|uniref:Porin n=1 Tax=Methylobacterium variabile TaxID=298794 RepID=A0A0J6STA6_9HYPH|nr:hypothetical protein [Methylobacterium variabile]KMO36588.1 hypothetical protein VQ02_15065 [Methylobacterium variabile]